MTTYNGSKYLQEQLDSFSNQTLLPNELVVVDDCSTDKTVKILKNFKNTVPFTVKTIVNNENLGSKIKYGFAKNFEKAINNCSGDVVFLSDQDDVWFPDKLEKHIKIYECNPCVQMVSNNAIRTYEDLTHTNFTQLDYGKIVGSNTINIGCCFSIRKNYLNSLLPFPDGTSHDRWLIKCTNYFKGIRQDIDEPLQFFRRLPSSWSSKNEFSNFVSTKECHNIRFKRFINYFIDRHKHSINLTDDLHSQEKLVELIPIISAYLKNNHIEQHIIVDGCNNMLNYLNLLKRRVFIQNSSDLFDKFNKILTTKKHNKQYSYKMMLKDFLAK